MEIIHTTKSGKVFIAVLRWEDGTPFDPGNLADMKKREQSHIKAREACGWKYEPSKIKAAV